MSAHDGTTETYTVTVTRKAPELQSVGLVSDPDASGADDDTYQIGDTMAAAAVFDVAVTVSGTPELELDVGGEARTAAYASGSGSTGLTFAYTVAEGDADADGVAIGADKLTAAGGASIAADGTPAVLTHEARNDADRPQGGRGAPAAGARRHHGGRRQHPAHLRRGAVQHDRRGGRLHGHAWPAAHSAIDERDGERTTR